MEKGRFTESQIVSILNAVEAGIKNVAKDNKDLHNIIDIFSAYIQKELGLM